MTLFWAIILLGILVSVHEFGHFLFAKLAGVRVLKFSLGFGPKLAGRKYGDTEYLISTIPLGGYVKMLGENPDEELKEEDRAFAYNCQPVWKRFLIVFAGPVFNIFFASLIFVFLFLSGVPVPYPDAGKIEENSPAAKAGLMTGDRIIEINGKSVESWGDIDSFMIDNPGKTLALRVKREGKIIELSVTPVKKTEKNIFGEDTKSWEIGVSPLLYPVIGEVMKGSRAKKAGLKKGDRIIQVDGKAIKIWQDLTSIIHDNPDVPLKFRIRRDGREMDLTITPEKQTFSTLGGADKTIGIIGIKPMGNDFIKRFNPIESAKLGIQKTWEISELTVLSLIKLIERVIPAETIGGPIMIFQVASQQASQGVVNFFTLMAFLSINLGILNLLPIPILDGGHIMFLGIEAIRRKPLDEKIISVSQKIGLAIILTLMALAFYNDIMRLVTGKQFPQ